MSRSALTAILATGLLALTAVSDKPSYASGSSHVQDAAPPQVQDSLGIYVLPSGLTVSSAAFNVFRGWYRYPAEERTWLPTTTSPEAYYRDILVAGRTDISGAVDGDTWFAEAVHPDGEVITSPTIQFHASFNGASQCFVAPTGILQCFSSNINILWYDSAQCVAKGQWTMRFFHNGALFHEGTFTTAPQIPPGKVTVGNQANDASQYGNFCFPPGFPGNLLAIRDCSTVPGGSPVSMADGGCFLYGYVGVLRYHGCLTTVAEVNQYLLANDGYGLDGDSKSPSLNNFAAARWPSASVVLSGERVAPDRKTVSSTTCQFGPQLLHVAPPDPNIFSGKHFVVAYGEDFDQTDILVADPGDGALKLLGEDYARFVFDMPICIGPEYAFSDPVSWIYITFHSPGEIFVQDPQGRRVGSDPVAGIDYNEIPGASYVRNSIARPTDWATLFENKTLKIPRPLDGEFLLQVTGTGVGQYALEIDSYDTQRGHSTFTMKDIPLSQGSVHKYSLDYSSISAQEAHPGGAFDGGGQRPRDVNRFLSYASIADRETVLPGATSLPLLLVYGASIQPATFTATLNGADISASFSPSAGSAQQVVLRLASGRNVLILTVSGLVGRRLATDTDRLIFTVR